MEIKVEGFYGCGRFGQPRRCNFFRWIDSENCRSCQVALLRMMLRLQEAEDEVVEARVREVEILCELRKMIEMNKLESTLLLYANEIIDMKKLQSSAKLSNGVMKCICK
ncbi:hypothetical protein MANES_18G125850v8 [Manihot esculenta]|uniref:Uncharacterized protein n=1 Tax=Manihot esculenta TaxID=3983 RepID=A0ACB7G083_MANES|nr:hypothetical protein MANES_18G125850v8 [Manihot esculenta]